MEFVTPAVRPPIKLHGAKSRLARRFISLFPPCSGFVDPTIGGGSIPLNLPPFVAGEVWADVNPHLIAFWRAVKNPETFSEVIDFMRRVPLTRDGLELAFVDAKEALSDPDYTPSLESWSDENPAEFAFLYLCKYRLSRGGLGEDFGWEERHRGGRPGLINSFATIIPMLETIYRRIQSVHFRCSDLRETLAAFPASSSTLTYIDPPYMLETRTAHDTYAHELTPKQADKQRRIDADRVFHRSILESIIDRPGVVAISGYRSDLYQEMLSGWFRVTVDMPNNAGQGREKQRRIESIWINPAGAAYARQAILNGALSR